MVWRLVLWFAGGALLYMCMAVTARVLPIAPLRFGLWWVGGLSLIGLELIVHAVLAWRRSPNFYGGRG